MKFLSNLFGSKNPPANNSNNPSTPPAHLNKRHPDDIRLYHKRLNALGDPRSQSVETYAKKLIVFELYQITGKRLRAEDLDVNAELMRTFGLDQIDLAAISMTFEDMYGEEISFPDWPPEQIPQLTSRDFIAAVTQHFNN